MKSYATKQIAQHSKSSKITVKNSMLRLKITRSFPNKLTKVSKVSVKG